MTPSPPASPSARVPVLWLAVCFACGIALASAVDFSPVVLSSIGVTAMILAAAFAKKKAAVIFVFTAFVMLGGLGLQTQTGTAGEGRIKRIFDGGHIRSGEPVEIEGVLVSGPEPAYDGTFLLVRVKSIRYKSAEQTASGDIRLFVLTKSEESREDYQALGLRYGSRIRVACSLDREERFLNPGVISRKALLDRQGIDAAGTVKSPLLIEKLGDENGFVPLWWIFELRAGLIEGFRENLSGPAAGIMIASLLGDKHFLDRETAEVFREGGTFHILVISGLHITFIGGILLWLVQRLTRRRVVHFVVPFVFLWAYALAVGAEVPVVRASLTFTVLLFSHVIYRQASLLNSLGFCTLLLLVWDSEDLFDPSFQLTIVSVTAIVAIAFPLIEKLRSIGSWMPDSEEPFPPNVPVWLKRFCEMLYWRERNWEIESGRQIWSARIFKSPYLKWLEAKNLQGIASYLFEGVTISLIVQICLLPLLVYYFHRVSVASVLLNLWVGIVIALESFAAIIGVFVSLISDTLALPFIQITEFLNVLLLRVPSFFADAIAVSFRVPIYSGWMRSLYGVYLLPVIAIAFVLVRWDPFALKRRALEFRACLIAGTVTTAFAALIVFHPLSTPSPNGRLTVEFLDVGQGDSAFISFPNGKTMLVDGGGRVSYSKPGAESTFEPDVPRIGESVVSEFLWERGYSRLDYIVATHADTDHIQGLSDIAKNFDVGTVLLGRIPPDDPELKEFLDVIDRYSIDTGSVTAGDSVDIGGVRLDVLHPKPAGIDGVSDNDNSVVLRLTFGSRSFLLTGDVEARGEDSLLNAPDLLRADVVKVPHHGSRTSSTAELVEAVKAEYAIISVGRNSIFGHPHAEIVERWQKSGAEVLVTGQRGLITVSTDGEGLVVKHLFTK